MSCVGGGRGRDRTERERGRTRRCDDYEVAYQFKDKVMRRPLSSFIFLVGGEKTTGCLNRLSALGWRIGGGPLTVVQSLGQGHWLSPALEATHTQLTVSGQPLFRLSAGF